MKTLKKMMLIFVVFLILTPSHFLSTTTTAEDNKERGIIYCDHYTDGKHRMKASGNATVLSRSGVTHFINWGYFKCLCGHNIVMEDYPGTTIFGYYFDDIPEIDIVDAGMGFVNVVTSDTPHHSDASSWDGYLWQYARNHNTAR